MYPTEHRPLRDVVRKRGHLVSQQTATVRSMQYISVCHTGARLRAKQIKALRPQEAAVLLFHEDHALAVSSV